LSAATIEAMYNKPDSTKTAQRCSAILLAAMAKVVKPSGVQVTWLADDHPVRALSCALIQLMNARP